MRATSPVGRGGLGASALALTALVLAALPGGAVAREEVPVHAVDMSAESGIGETALTYGATVADWNEDEWDDVLVVRHYDSFPRLYMNDGAGVFENVSETAFLGAPPKRDYHDCPAADVDLDGRLDIYCTLGGKSGGNGPNPNELWLQTTDGQFVERAEQYNATDAYGRGRQATFVDANGDQYPDLYIANAYPRLDGHRGSNRLLINFLGMSFRVGREYDVHHNIAGSSVQAVDFDRDGWEDLLVCGDRGVVLYRNRLGEVYRNVAEARGIAGGCRYTMFARMNGDARPDLVRLTRDRLTVTAQRPDGRFRQTSLYERTLYQGRSFELGDVNGDGEQDLYVLRAGRYLDVFGAEQEADPYDVMLVNQGLGRSFSPMPMPQTREGIGDAVTAIDHDRNGLDDFIVMNGYRKASGPIRLVAFYPG